MKKQERSPLSAMTAGMLGKKAERQEYVASPRLKQKDRGKREGQTNMTFFMAISTHKAIKELAATRGVSLQQQVAEWVDRGLAEAGEAPFKVRD